jgi:hypothetical protein
MQWGGIREQTGQFLSRQRLALTVATIVFFAAFTVAYVTPGSIFRSVSNAFSGSLDVSFLSCAMAKTTSEAFECAHAQMLEWVEHYGVVAVVAEMDKYQARFGSDERCHLIGHEVGAAVLTAEHDDLGKAMAMCSQACNSGCIHGAVMQYTAVHGIAAFTATHPEQTCAQVIPDQYLPCIHGLGHAYMVATNYDLSASLADCDKLDLDGMQKRQCYSGVFMELFDAAQGLSHETIPQALYYRPGDPEYPCDSALVHSHFGYEEACFIQHPATFSEYAAAHHMSLLQACDQAPTKFRDACAIGVGLAVAQTSNLSSVAKACDVATDSTLRLGCLYGAYSFIREGKDGLQLSTQLCSVFSPADRVVCDPLYPDEAALGIVI